MMIPILIALDRHPGDVRAHGHRHRQGPRRPHPRELRHQDDLLHPGRAAGHQHVQHHVRVRRGGGRSGAAGAHPVHHGARWGPWPSRCSSCGATTASWSGCSWWPASSTSPTSSPPSWPSRTGARSRKATVVPHIEPITGFLLLAIGLVGTTIAPWMQFYIQASTVEKSVKKEELAYARVDVIAGSIMAVAVAAFIIITCARHPLQGRDQGGVRRRGRQGAGSRWPESTPRRCSPSGCWRPACSRPASCRCPPPTTSARAWAGRPA